MAEATASRVIILGAGPVGMGAALELARFGVPSLLLERRDGIHPHPRTRNFNTRTMEIARGWGRAVYQRLRSIDTPPGWKSPIRFLDTATGKEFGRIESLGFAGPGPAVSPCEPVMSSQDLIEEILLDAVRASDLIELRFGVEGTRLVRGGSDGDRDAALEVRDRRSGASQVVVGPALVAADGAASLIRSELGVGLEGPQGITHLVNCYFRADIERHLGERKAVLYFVSNERARGVLQPLDAAGRWLCQINVAPEDWSLDAFTKARARDWVRAAVGVESLEPEIVSLVLWKLNAAVAERLVQGRVLLCGDAANLFPPTGGLGLNTGLQSMHNAIWKLAACVKGQAGWPLLETYHGERRPVVRRTVSQSLENAINVARIGAAAMGQGAGLASAEAVTASRRYGNHLGVELGAAYASPAVVPDGSAPPQVADDYSDYAPSATPGCRAPHVWLGRADGRLSTLDLFGPAFALLAAPRASAWLEAAATARRALDVRIDAYRIGSAGLQDDAGEFARVYGLDPDGAVLVRPDGYVAWRSARAPARDSELADALRRILAR